METTAITNARELLSQLQRLKGIKPNKRRSCAYVSAAPGAVIASARSFFPKKKKAQRDGLLHSDILYLVSRFAIPFTLNKTIFTHFNFLDKVLVGLVSQKPAWFVTEDKTEFLLTKGKALFNKLFLKQNTFINR